MTFLPFRSAPNRNSEFQQTTTRMMIGMCLNPQATESLLLNSCIHDIRGGVVNEIAYFLVTNVEHSVITSATTYKEDDLYAESTLGELGCWVDSSFTRMMQTGFEHARVPDVGSYLELGMAPLCLSHLSNLQFIEDLQQTRSTYSSLKRHPSSRLFRRDSPFRKLLSLVSACFGDRSGDYQLQLSVLLKGVRGVGKFTTVCWVAQQLGLHVLEVI